MASRNSLLSSSALITNRHLTIPIGLQIDAYRHAIRVTVLYELDHNPPSNNTACCGSEPCHERLAIFSK
jgi:hypothetical protein